MRSGQLPLFDVLGAPTLRELADAVRVAGLEGLPHAVRRADQARYQEVSARSALAAVKGMPFKWALNPYRGCTHACEYCYARKYQSHLELGADDFSSVIIVKPNLPEVLARELRRPSWAHEGVAVGTATDPYQPIEGHYKVTRRCLEVLADSGTPFTIVTKGPMVVRDRDVLMRAQSGAGACVYLSVPSVDEEAWKKLEPGTAPPAQRLHAARALQLAGIETGILMMPLVPGITTTRASIERTLSAIRESGVRFAGASVARLDPGVREFFFAFLEREYPHLLDGYERLYRGTSASREYVSAVLDVVRARKSAGTTDRTTSDAREAPESEPLSEDGSRTAPTSPLPKTAS
jgi:DNA repair photolyase